MAKSFVNNVKTVMNYNKLIYRIDRFYFYLIKLNDTEYKIRYYGRNNNGPCRDITLSELNKQFTSGDWTPVKYLSGHTFCKKCKK